MQIKRSKRGSRVARTAKNSKYAKARVAAGITTRELLRQGFGSNTINNADNGQLPLRPRNRAAYLAAIKYKGKA